MIETASTQKLAEYLRNQARWRQMKADEWDDDRNRRSAKALEEAADYVDTLNDGDKRIRAMERAKYFLEGTDVCMPGEEGRNLIRTWNFTNTPVIPPILLLTSPRLRPSTTTGKLSAAGDVPSARAPHPADTCSREGTPPPRTRAPAAQFRSE
jgi:hypothetical protein